MRVTRAECTTLVVSPSYVCFEAPLQAGLGRDPWRVAVASMLLQRARRAQASPTLEKLLHRWPTPNALAIADLVELEEVLRPCGLHRQRARQLQRMSGLYISESWEDLRELPGVGAYTSDAVGLFCFGRTDLECDDRVLREHAEALAKQEERAASQG